MKSHRIKSQLAEPSASLPRLSVYPGHLLIDDCYVKALSLKEPTAQSWPLILRQLLEVGASYHIVTEWKAQDNTAARKRIQSMRRHFHNSKTSLFSQLKADGSTNPSELLVDDSKESLVRSLGDRLVSGRDSTPLLLHQGTMPDCGDSECG